jgi:hypothetical protein
MPDKSPSTLAVLQFANPQEQLAWLAKLNMVLHD